MRDLLPFLRLYRQHWVLLSTGLLLSLFTLMAGIGLLSLSGWFLSAAAVAGLSLLGRQSFNYLLPAGAVRFLSIIRTATRTRSSSASVSSAAPGPNGSRTSRARLIEPSRQAP